MNEKQLFDAIHNADDSFIDEAIQYTDKKDKKCISIKAVLPKLIAAVLAVITIAGTSITVLATVNPDFKEWLYQSFGSSRVTKITDLKSNTDFAFDENTRITGVNESFIEKYATDNSDHEIVSEVYHINKNKIVQLKKKSFKGTYNHIDFKFDYCTIHNEIDAFNYSSNISEVFHYKDGNRVYMALDDEKQTVEYIFRINLKSGEIVCIDKHRHFCNMIMSPNGKTILLNYRALEYWSVLDLETQKQTRLDSIFPYAHIDEILFLNDYLIETYGGFDENDVSEVPKTIVINLKNFKTKTVCEGTGDICSNWFFNYDVDKNTLVIQNLYKNTSFSVNNISGEYSISTVEADKNYALFYNEVTKEYYLCNLIEETSMRFSVPDELSENVEIFIAGSENKLIITDASSAYLIDIHSLRK